MEEIDYQIISCYKKKLKVVYRQKWNSYDEIEVIENSQYQVSRMQFFLDEKIYIVLTVCQKHPFQKNRDLKWFMLGVKGICN